MVARALPQDDIIVLTTDGTVAMVHLTWSGHPETPPWPRTHLLQSQEHFESLIEACS